MCEVIDIMINKGRQDGLAEGLNLKRKILHRA